MAKFDITKTGYDTEQVDTFIDKLTLKYEEKLSEQKDKIYTLKNEVSLLQDRVNVYTEKDRQISKALIFAVENAEKIEANANNLFDMEIKRIRLLYSEWQSILAMISSGTLDNDTIKKVKAFDVTLNDLLNKNTNLSQGKGIKTSLKKSSDNYIKNLLNQMDYVINNKDDKVEQKKALNNLTNVHTKENKRIANIKQKNMAVTSKMEDYLRSDDEVESAYSKNIVRSKYVSKSLKTMVYEPNETGFDIQEALNVKDDLSVVMQGFDFFDEIESNKKNKK